MCYSRVVWYKISLATMLAVLMLSLIAPPALGDGIIIPQPPVDVPITEVPNLTIRYHHVTVRINGPVAITHVDQVFVNESRHNMEGIYVFPLPADAAVSDFAMTVDGKRMQGELLTRDEARRIYEEIVRRRRDPALLEYVGRGAFRASIFPIPPKGERRIEIEYSQILETQAGLTHYSYPLNTERFSARPIESVSISVDLRADAPLKAIYSPSHQIAVSREGRFRARIGYEEAGTRPERDFELYFSTSAEPFGLNVLSYKPAGEDGFFLLLASPEMTVEQPEVVARDIIFVLDTSGSMQGEKIRQAKEAVRYVLDHLNPNDRFNLIDFSTGVNRFAPRLVPASQRAEASRYVDALQARGGTDIDRALTEALSYTAGADRPQVIIFVTDGLPTQGVVDTDKIIANVDKAAGPKVRLFTFGVGYDVNTVLLDAIAQAHGGTSAYIRPGENIEEKISDFYAKIGSPVLSQPKLEFDGVQVQDTYPYPLPDFFLGSQLVLVGRYRRPGSATITLRGEVNGRVQQHTYRDVQFASAGGDPAIARLWATRKVGHLLNQIRLHGQNKELIDELVELSIRYGIVTPYTSYLVQEDRVFTQEWKQRIAERELRAGIAAPAPASGQAAVEKSIASQDLGRAEVAPPPAQEQIRTVADKVFALREGVWTDTRYEADRMSVTKVKFGSPAYFDLLTRYPNAGRYLALGVQVLVVLDGTAYQVGEEGQTEPAQPAATWTPVAARPLEMPTPTPSAPWGETLWRWLWQLFRK